MSHSRNGLVKAVATFIPNSNSNISGIIYFEQSIKGGTTKIFGHINGLNIGKHGIHVHEYGDLSNGCDSAGAHYNPFGVNHGGPMTEHKHAGDFGNIECNNTNGSSFFHLVSDFTSLIGPTSIIGRSLIIHENEDDLGYGNSPLSKTTGNSGARIACTVIGIAK